MARRKSSPDFERLVLRLVRNEHVQGLVDLMLDEETPAAYQKSSLEGLIDIDSVEAWDAVCELVAHHEGHVVELVIDVLGHKPAAGALRALGECLGNPHPFVRSEAVRAISRHVDPQSLALLLRGSRDPEPAIGRMAGRSLVSKLERAPASIAEIRTSTAEGIVGLLGVHGTMEYLSDAYPEPLRIVAARRLGEIGGDEATGALVSLVEALRGPVSDACWGALEVCHTVSDQLVVPLLAHSDAEVRARSIAIYGRCTDATAAELLSGLAGDPDSDVRIASLNALFHVLEAAARPHLDRALDDAEAEVRLRAVELLCALPDTTGVLQRVVSSEDGLIKRKALTALANRGVVTRALVMDYTEFLLEGASVTDLSDREYLNGLGAAAKVLGQKSVPEGLVALTALVRSVIKRLRRVAVEGIMAYAPADRADSLSSLADSYDMDVLKSVAFGLHEGSDPRAIVPLIRASYESKGRSQLRAHALLKDYEQVSELDFLVALLKSRWASVRRYGAERLSVIHDSRSIPPLLEASRDDDVEVQLAVFEALASFATESEEVVERMLEALSYGDISVRQKACEALGEARCKAAIPHLIKALYNFFLRPRASEALKRIGDRKGYLALKRIERRESLFPKKPKDALEEERRRKRAALDA